MFPENGDTENYRPGMVNLLNERMRINPLKLGNVTSTPPSESTDTVASIPETVLTDFFVPP